MEYFNELFDNKPLWIAITSFFLAQFTKIILHLVSYKKFDMKLIMGSGGMPSSHSSFVMALTTAVGIKEGLDSTYFAIATVISFVIMYDAAGVRRAAGNQAAIINRILDNVGNQNIKIDKKLKELLGHTPIEVAAGAVLGIATGIIGYKYF